MADHEYDYVPEEMKQYADRINVALALLTEGREPDQIADMLRALGIKGTSAAADICPLAHYVRKYAEIPEEYQFNIYGTWSLRDRRRYVVYTGETPEEAYRFARKFDRAKYPDLIEESTTTDE